MILKKFIFFLLFLLIPLTAQGQYFDVGYRSSDRTAAEATDDTLSKSLEILNDLDHYNHCVSRLITQHEMQTADVKMDSSEVSHYPFDLTAADDSTFGTAVQLTGADDTPWTTGYTKFCIDKLCVVSVNSNVMYKIRISWGASAAAGWTAGNYTDMIFRTDSTNPQYTGTMSKLVQMPLIDAGSLLWCQIANAAGAQTAELIFIGHEIID